MVKITKLEYFEEKATDLEALVNSAFPQLETEAFIDQDGDSVSVQSELEVPGFEDTVDSQCKRRRSRARIRVFYLHGRR